MDRYIHTYSKIKLIPVTANNFVMCLMWRVFLFSLMVSFFLFAACLLKPLNYSASHNRKSMQWIKASKSPMNISVRLSVVCKCIVYVRQTITDIQISDIKKFTFPSDTLKIYPARELTFPIYIPTTTYKRGKYIVCLFHKFEISMKYREFLHPFEPLTQLLQYIKIQKSYIPAKFLPLMFVSL